MIQSDMRAALHKWSKLTSVEWDVGCCLHIPEQMRLNERTWDQYGLSKIICRYFNRIDRCLFKSAVKRHNKRMQRFVVAEYADAVGWHCHFIAKSPQHLTTEKLETSLRTQWERITNVSFPSNIQAQLFWSEPLAGNYQAYCTKRAFRADDDPFDGRGTQVTSIIDWRNTVL